MNRNDYDTLTGIERQLETLEDFNKLVDERHNAGYKRQERLQEYSATSRV